MKVLLASMALVLALSLPALAQTDSAKADARIAPLLDKLGYTYDIDEDGDYRVVFEFDSEKRSQIVFVNSNTVEFQGMEIREIWSPAFKSKGPFTAKIANRLLEASYDAAIGAWQTWKLSDGTYMAVFSVKLGAETDAKTIGAVVSAVISVADDMEKELSGTDEY